MKNKIFHRFLCIMFAAGIFMGFGSIRVYAENKKAPVGGINYFGGKVLGEDRISIGEFESKLKENGYIIAARGENGKERDEHITDEMIEFLKKCNIYTNELSLLQNGDAYAEEYYTVWVWEYGLDYCFSEYQKNGALQQADRFVFCSSAVLTDYSVFDIRERSGNCINNLTGNGIPEWSNTGWIEIKAPAHVTVRLTDFSSLSYYEFNISPNTPFKEKIIASSYYVSYANDIPVPKKDGSVPNKNKISVWNSHTEQNPYVLDLYSLCVNYGIKDAEIKDKPNPYNGDFELIILDDKQGEEKKNIGVIIIVVGSAAAAVIIAAVAWIRKKRKWKR